MKKCRTFVPYHYNRLAAKRKEEYEQIMNEFIEILIKMNHVLIILKIIC